MEFFAIQRIPNHYKEAYIETRFVRLINVENRATLVINNYETNLSAIPLVLPICDA